MSTAEHADLMANLTYGVLGAVFATVFSSFGAAYGTARAGRAVSDVAVMRPDLIMKSLVPIIMAGILAIYGLVISVLISNEIKKERDDYTLYKGLTHFGGGLSVGLNGLAAGMAIGIVGDSGVRGNAHEPRLFVGMILMLIFAEVLGLYGMIIAIFFYADACQFNGSLKRLFNFCDPDYKTPLSYHENGPFIWMASRLGNLDRTFEERRNQSAEDIGAVSSRYRTEKKKEKP